MPLPQVRLFGVDAPEKSQVHAHAAACHACLHAIDDVDDTFLTGSSEPGNFEHVHCCKHCRHAETHADYSMLVARPASKHWNGEWPSHLFGARCAPGTSMGVLSAYAAWWTGATERTWGLFLSEMGMQWPTGTCDDACHHAPAHPRVPTQTCSLRLPLAPAGTACLSC